MCLVVFRIMPIERYDMKKEIVYKTQPYPNPPYINIATGRAAQWANSPVFISDPNADEIHSPTAAGFCCSPTTSIVMSGSRNIDRQNVLKLFPKMDDGYDFHHTYSFTDGGKYNSTCNGQMVLRRNHNSSKPHTGAVKQYTEVYGRYSMEFNNFILSEEYKCNCHCEITADSIEDDAQINYFSSIHKLDIPEWLFHVYTGKKKLPKYYRTEKDDVESVQDIAHLTDKSVHDCSVEFLLTLPHIQEKLAKTGISSALPFAFDPCGNVFIASKNVIYFFDDECDYITKVTPID